MNIFSFDAQLFEVDMISEFTLTFLVPLRITHSYEFLCFY